MKNLLEKDFIKHYSLEKFNAIDIVSKNDNEFVLIDSLGKGEAKYSNPDRQEVTVIDYESFFKSLPHDFQQHKNNCDFIVYVDNNRYFLLNELTNTNKGKGRKRTHAISQMLQTLQLLSAVSSIRSFINQHSVKQCCYFNKKYQAPQVITAVLAYNRLSALSSNGYRMPDAEIEKFGFELWEFSGNQTYLLKDEFTILLLNILK